MNKLRLLLVDSCQLLRVGLRTIFERQPELSVVGEASTARETLLLADRLQPDIVVMDLQLPDERGTLTCQEIRQRWPQIRVVVLTTYVERELILEAISAGVDGYLLKHLPSDEVVASVKAIGRGQAVLDPAVTVNVLHRVRVAEAERHAGAFHKLSQRECEVLALVATGKTNAEIAEQLVLSEKTVSNHVSTILSKLELTNRIEAATYAVRHHLDRISEHRLVASN